MKKLTYITKLIFNGLIFLVALTLLMCSAISGYLVVLASEYSVVYALWLIPAAIGTYLMHWQMPEKSIGYWILLFPVTGMLCGLVWLFNDKVFGAQPGKQIPVAILVYLGMYFLVNFMEGRQNRKLPGDGEAETPT